MTATKETTVLNAVVTIINRRRAAHRFPECALRREIIAETAGIIPYHELTRILMQLVRDGKLLYKPAISDQSYYLTNQ